MCISVLKMKVLRGVDLTLEQQFEDQNSVIKVKTPNSVGGEERSIAFQSFTGFGCILDDREDW